MDSLTEKISSELKNIQKEMFDAAKKILDERVVKSLNTRNSKKN